MGTLYSNLPILATRPQTAMSSSPMTSASENTGDFSEEKGSVGPAFKEHNLEAGERLQRGRLQSAPRSVEV